LSAVQHASLHSQQQRLQHLLPLCGSYTALASSAVAQQSHLQQSSTRMQHVNLLLTNMRIRMDILSELLCTCVAPAGEAESRA
jgi:hypothetical protein